MGWKYTEHAIGDRLFGTLRGVLIVIKYSSREYQRGGESLSNWFKRKVDMVPPISRTDHGYRQKFRASLLECAFISKNI